MADYCKCKYCYYCNTSERDGYKCYCEILSTYVDPDELTECSHYKD